MNAADRLTKVRELNKIFQERLTFYWNKYRRARKWEIQEQHFQRWKLYNKLCRRISRLLYEMTRNPDVKKEVDQDCIRSEYRARLRRKAENKEKFMNLRRCTIWFMSESFGADYGEYKCDKCGRTFFHSPATIRLAGKVLYDCCCGHCTNDIMFRDWGKEIYY